MSKIKMQDSEAILKIPNELCQHIYNCEFEIDIGNVDEHLIAKTIELYSVRPTLFRKPSTSTSPRAR